MKGKDRTWLFDRDLNNVNNNNKAEGVLEFQKNRETFGVFCSQVNRKAVKHPEIAMLNIFYQYIASSQHR
jgi:hypothetical protein